MNDKHLIILRMKLGKQLSEIRKKKNLNKAAVYKDTLHRERLDDIETGRSNYTIDTLLRYFNALNINLISLLKHQNHE